MICNKYRNNRSILKTMTHLTQLPPIVLERTERGSQRYQVKGTSLIVERDSFAKDWDVRLDGEHWVLFSKRTIDGVRDTLTTLRNQLATMQFDAD